jgi:hypothetical protein
MAMREMSLDRVKELLIRVTCELRPALAVSDPSQLFGDHCPMLRSFG